MAMPSNGGDMGGQEGPTHFKLDPRERKFMLGVLAFAFSVIVALIGAMFYVLTPKQTHNADIAEVNKDMAVVKEKHKTVAEDVEGIEDEHKDFVKTMRRIERRQDMMAPHRVRREVPLPDKPLP